MSYKAKYPTPESLEKAAEEYFDSCDEKEEPYSVAGLAYFLGFQSREALAQIKSKKPEFTYVIDRTRLKMEAAASKIIQTGSKTVVAGTIFYLKACFGWEDTQKQDIHIHGSIQAMTDEQLDQRLTLALKELVKGIGLDGLKKLGFDGEIEKEGNNHEATESDD